MTKTTKTIRMTHAVNLICSDAQRFKGHAPWVWPFLLPGLRG
jgi:hypothetical protein